jgi:cobalt-zinc-cadmium efflux system outer membrane protein
MKSARLSVTLVLLCVWLVGIDPLRAQSGDNVAGHPSYYAGDAQLGAYLTDALRQNPAIREAAARYRAALQLVPQVRELPDPMVTFTQALRSVETRVGPQHQTVMLSQAFPWFGTLALREQVAVQAAAAHYHQYVVRQRDVIADVKQAFYDLAYVDRALAITEEERSLLGHYEELAQARFATGQGQQQGVIRLQAEITRVISRLELLDQQRITLAARVNTLRAEPPERPVPRVGALTLPRVTLDLERLYALGDQQRPDLQAAVALIERSERAIALAQKAFWPTVTVGVGYQSIGGRDDPAGRLSPPPDNGKNPLTLSLGATIPIRRSSIRAGVEQANEELVAEHESYDRMRDEMEFSVRDAVVRLQTLRSQIDLFEQVMIPQTEETLRVTEAAYENAQAGVLDLLDGERMRLDVRLINARYYADYLVALAQLERAIGTVVPQQQGQP